MSDRSLTSPWFLCTCSALRNALLGNTSYQDMRLAMPQYSEVRAQFDLCSGFAISDRFRCWPSQDSPRNITVFYVGRDAEKLLPHAHWQQPFGFEPSPPLLADLAAILAALTTGTQQQRRVEEMPQRDAQRLLSALRLLAANLHTLVCVLLWRSLVASDRSPCCCTVPAVTGSAAGAAAAKEPPRTDRRE